MPVIGSHINEVRSCVKWRARIQDLVLNRAWKQGYHSRFFKLCAVCSQVLHSHKSQCHWHALKVRSAHVHGCVSCALRTGFFLVLVLGPGAPMVHGGCHRPGRGRHTSFFLISPLSFPTQYVTPSPWRVLPAVRTSSVLNPWFYTESSDKHIVSVSGFLKSCFFLEEGSLTVVENAVVLSTCFSSACFSLALNNCLSLMSIALICHTSAIFMLTPVQNFFLGIST